MPIRMAEFKEKKTEKIKCRQSYKEGKINSVCSWK